MKATIYISALLVCLLSGCSTTQRLAGVMEDDIYYVPGESSLFACEVEKKTGLKISEDKVSVTASAPARGEGVRYDKENARGTNPLSYKIGMARYGNADTLSGSYVTITPEEEAAARNGIVERAVTDLPEGEGYWLNGFNGSASDLKICEQIIQRYPMGFATFGHDSDIANWLSMSSDWNVFTYDNRYWWFPTPSNINLYHELVFGNYPKYIWTIIWNDPRFGIFEAYDFFDPFHGVGSFRYYNPDPWYNRYYSATYWGLDPWRYAYASPYGPWGWGYYGGYYDPWGWHYGWNGYYGYYSPYWGYYPHWHDRWYPHRPGGGSGGIVVNPQPSKHVARTKFTTNRDARSYNTSTRAARYRSVNTRRDNTYTPATSRPENRQNYSTGQYRRGSSGASSYGRSTTRHSGSGTRSNERVNTGSRR